MSFALGLADQVSGALPQSSQAVADVLTQTYGVDDQGKVQGNPADNVFAGMNAVSMFGNPIEAAQKRIDNVVDPAKKEKFQKQLESVQYKVENQISAPQENIGAVSIKDTANVEVDLPTSTIDTFRGPNIGEVTDGGPTSDEDPSGIEEEMSEGSIDTSGPSQDTGGPYSGGEGGVQSGLDSPDVGEVSSDAGFEDSGNGNGNGKGIVCTAMYQTTGLEDWSKAMKIWYIYQQKYLTIQHQEGYHKLFKPFVKGMYKSKIIKAIGAHVAKHRTQHLKHVMFNSKPSLLGKIYSKILEPICYWVGKYAKR